MSRPADHALRRPLSDLMHERTIPVFIAPVVLRSWVYLVADTERAAESQWIASLAQDDDLDRWRHAEITGTGGYIWERHGEFSTYLAFSTAGKTQTLLRNNFGFCSLRTEDFHWLSGAPGSVFRSVEIVVLPHAPKPQALQAHIDLTPAVCCDVFDGHARIWSDFRMHEGGAGRIYIQDKGLRNDELSRLLQSLIEIGHYRKLALLGFPVARDLMGWLKGAETQLNAITSDMAGGAASQQQILDRLMTLSAEVEHRVTSVRFRQGATEAYARLAHDRLATLREARVEGFSTLQEFIERRLQPAMRTCEAASKRLDDLSQRLGRVSDLLRARISISLEMQNQDLLKSMDLRSKLQMKLSHLVEGLSVFAVSYYVFNLVKYAVDPWFVGHEDLAHKLYAVIIVAILGLAWLFITHRKRSITVEAGE